MHIKKIYEKIIKNKTSLVIEFDANDSISKLPDLISTTSQYILDARLDIETPELLYIRNWSDDETYIAFLEKAIPGFKIAYTRYQNTQKPLSTDSSETKETIDQSNKVFKPSLNPLNPKVIRFLEKIYQRFNDLPYSKKFGALTDHSIANTCFTALGCQTDVSSINIPAYFRDTRIPGSSSVEGHIQYQMSKEEQEDAFKWFKLHEKLAALPDRDSRTFRIVNTVWNVMAQMLDVANCGTTFLAHCFYKTKIAAREVLKSQLWTAGDSNAIVIFLKSKPDNKFSTRIVFLNKDHLHNGDNPSEIERLRPFGYGDQVNRLRNKKKHETADVFRGFGDKNSIGHDPMPDVISDSLEILPGEIAIVSLITDFITKTKEEREQFEGFVRNTISNLIEKFRSVEEFLSSPIALLLWGQSLVQEAFNILRFHYNHLYHDNSSVISCIASETPIVLIEADAHAKKRHDKAKKLAQDSVGIFAWLVDIFSRIELLQLTPKDKQDNNPLHEAILAGKKDKVIILLGADDDAIKAIHQKNGAGLDCFELALYLMLDANSNITDEKYESSSHDDRIAIYCELEKHILPFNKREQELSSDEDTNDEKNNENENADVVVNEEYMHKIKTYMLNSHYDDPSTFALYLKKLGIDIDDPRIIAEDILEFAWEIGDKNIAEWIDNQINLPSDTPSVKLRM